MGNPRSSNQTKITIAIIAMFLAMIVVIALVMHYCGKTGDPDNPVPSPSQTLEPQDENLEEYIVHTWVKDGENIYESRVYRETKYKDYYVNDEYNSNLEKIASLSTKALPIEDFTTVDKSTIDTSFLFDLTETDTPIRPLTWEADTNYSTMYVLYLLGNNWEVTRQAVTPTYCEIYLRNGEILKRVIIFKSSIMASDVSDTDLPEVSSYFK